MHTSTEGLMAIVGHEGVVLTPYKDSVGVWTLGIGHTKAAGNPDPAKFTGELTVSEAFGLLRHDIMRYEADVNQAVTVPLAQHEFDALVSFHYNSGAIKKASFVKRLNAGDRAGAIAGIMDWRKPKEIIPRRTAERDLFKTGRYPAPFATLYPADSQGRVKWSQGKRIDLREYLKPAPPAVPAEAPKPVPAPELSPTPQSSPVAPPVDWLARVLGWLRR